jgi:hypothetical protein
MFRTLTYAQKQRVTTNLFWAVGFGCVFTVAAPTLFPCPVVSSPYNQDDKMKQVKIVPNTKLIKLEQYHQVTEESKGDK